ncbi:glycosyltransferase [Streptomyces sp. BPTC-684]|uniref:glycosyltransferase n=1 Tax=Streptomyces sp. BPTC-684 TaxID=3043734 RepID=UPI0024B083B1|nr:glycosyltransferase [Streptomyces sp. BPTC-684]WHM36514.1 glycosyltransferase [Streptomyces sp. BPTC-684]
MRILMMSTAVPTHFAPLVPLAWGLRAAGAEVLVTAQPDVMPMIRSAGLVGAPVGEKFDGDTHLRGFLTEGRRPLESFTRFPPEEMGFYGRVWMDQARRNVHAYLELAREWKPQLIVADQVEYASLLIGGVLGIPVVHHRWGVDPISDLAMRDARGELADLAEEFGLDELPTPTEVLDPCPPSLQMPSASKGTPIRHVPFNGYGELPAWRGRPDTRRVVVTLGTRTLQLNGVPHVRHVLQAAASVPDVEVIGTVPPEYWDELGPMPAAVQLVSPTPLHLFMDSCDAMVHHSGSGTMLTATTVGLPQLALPQWSDQFALGERLEASGAGIALDDVAGQDDAELVRDSVALLLDKPEYRTAAEGLGREIAAMPTPAEVAMDLLRKY